MISKMLISEENKTQLIKRIKSLGWRAFDMAIVLVANFIASNIGLFNLDPFIIMLIGLVAGEITKYFSNKNK